MILKIDLIVSLIAMVGCTVQPVPFGNFGNCDYHVRLNANEGTSVVNPGK